MSVTDLGPADDSDSWFPRRRRPSLRDVLGSSRLPSERSAEGRVSRIDPRAIMPVRAPEEIDDGRDNSPADLIREGIRRGVFEDLPQLARGAPELINDLVHQVIRGEPSPRSQIIPQMAQDAGLTDPSIEPEEGNYTGHLAAEGSRFLGSAILPEALMARFGARVARQIASGALRRENLSWSQRAALEYVERPAASASANVTGAGGAVVGGDIAEALGAPRVVGEIPGGFLGGMAPFARRPRQPDVSDEGPGIPRVSDEDLFRDAIDDQSTPPSAPASAVASRVANDDVMGGIPMTRAEQDWHEHILTSPDRSNPAAYEAWLDRADELQREVERVTGFRFDGGKMAANEEIPASVNMDRETIRNILARDGLDIDEMEAAVGSVTRPSRPRFLQVDNPGGEWLARKQFQADSDYDLAGTGLTARGLHGSTTGYARVNIPIRQLEGFPGVNGEAPRAGQSKYDEVFESIRENGYDPKSRIMVWVNHRGEPFIYEGNNRLAAARANGVESIPVEIQWRNGAEDVDGPLFPEKVAEAVDNVFPIRLSIEPDAPVSVYDENGRLVGRYRNIQQARQMKPGHVYIDDSGNRTSDAGNFIDDGRGDPPSEPTPRSDPEPDPEPTPPAADVPVSVYNEDGRLVGRYQNIATARKMKPGHVYIDDSGNRTSDAGNFIDDGRGDPPSEPTPRSDPEPTPPVADDVIQRLTTALNNAKKLNREQRALRTEALSKKIARVRGVRQGTSGEAGLHAELSQLKGDQPRVDFEGVRGDFTQEEIDSLFDAVKNNQSLSVFDSINARVGLAKLLNGTVPTRGELDLLGRVFPPDFIRAALRNRRFMQKVMDAAGNLLNLPRSLMSSMDLSAPFRQGLFLVGRPEFWKAWGTMFREFGHGWKTPDTGTDFLGNRSRKWKPSFSPVLNEIRSRPTYSRMKEAGLAITELGGNLTKREETFQSDWAQKIPVIGRMVRASEHAFTGFLNKLRADVFDSIYKLSHEADIDFRRNPKALRDIASFINAATGRGSLGKLSQAGPILNGLFFSPRLMSSRLTLLNPVYYAQLSPVVRREAVKSLLATGGIVSTILGLAAFAGLDVELDPRSSDFGKIRSGDTRFDIMGGFSQYITLGARLVSNSTVTISGQERELGEGYRPTTRLDVLETFLTNKMSPVASYVTDYLRGSNFLGEEFEPVGDALQRFVPMFVQDVYDEVSTRGSEGALTAAPGLLGVGVQTFDTPVAFDPFGRNYHDLPSEETDPTILEVNRLTQELGENIINPVRGNDVRIGNEVRDLTPDELARYQETAGRYILEDLRRLVASPEYQAMTSEQRGDAIRRVVRDQRANAREDLAMPQATEGAGVTEIPLSEAPSGPEAPSAALMSSDEGEADAGVTDLGEADAGASIIRAIFPGVHVTDNIRDPDSPLGRANPGSRHIHSRMAVDVRPIRGMTFREYLRRIREAGYSIVESRDEVTNPTAHATGPHWHVVLGDR